MAKQDRLQPTLDFHGHEIAVEATETELKVMMKRQNTHDEFQMMMVRFESLSQAERLLPIILKNAFCEQRRN